MTIMAGDQAPDPKDSIGTMYYDLWEGARAADRELADEAMAGLFFFMRAQTDRRRGDLMSFGQYLEYRDKDIARV
jgi:aristolochene synthase